MQIKVNDVRLQYNENQQPEIILTTSGDIRKEIAELKNILVEGKELTAEIKQYRKKRSLNANAYLWVLLSEMAAALHTTKDELYIQMLDRYGVFTFVVVKPSVVDRVKQEWRTVRELGEITVNGKTGIQLQCFFGSSTYSSKEMATLIDGVVSECEEMGIETMQKEELESIKKEWGNKNE